MSNQQNTPLDSVQQSSFLSIDQWQDTDASGSSWITNPFSGALLVIVSVTCLLLFGTLRNGTFSNAPSSTVVPEKPFASPVVARDGSETNKKADSSFELLAKQLAKQPSRELAQQFVSQFDQTEQQLVVAYTTLREMDLEPSRDGATINVITTQLNSYFQNEIRDSRDQDGMISLAAVLPRWETPKRSFPLITKAIKHATMRNGNYGQLDQQYLDIFKAASQSKTPEAAEVLVSLLQHNYGSPSGMKQEDVYKAIEDIGEPAKEALLPLAASSTKKHQDFAAKMIKRFGGVDQTKMLEQFFSIRNTNTISKKLESMEIEPANHAYVARKIREHGRFNNLKEFYFKYAGSAEMESLKEMAAGTPAYRYPAIRRLLEVDFQEGVSTMKKIYRENPNDLPYSAIERAADDFFEPALLELLNDTNLEPNRYFLEVFEKAGTAKSIPSLQAFKQRIEAIKPKDNRQRRRNETYIEIVNEAIKKIESKE